MKTTGFEEITQIRDSDTGEWCYVIKPRLNIGDVVKIEANYADEYFIDTVRGYAVDLFHHEKSLVYKGKIQSFTFKQVRATLAVKETFDAD